MVVAGDSGGRAVDESILSCLLLDKSLGVRSPCPRANEGVDADRVCAGSSRRRSLPDYNGEKLECFESRLDVGA